MIQVDLTNVNKFLPGHYEDELIPRLRQAHEQLQKGSGVGGEFTGWERLTRDYDRDEYRRIKEAARRIRENSQALVVIGIGGSYLGARGVIECLRSPNYNLRHKDTPNIYFVGNGLSSDALEEVMELVQDVDFSVNVISKSGTTTEPAVAFRFFRAMLENKYGDKADEHIFATTDAKRGALKSLANDRGWESFVVPDDVGGRFSVLSAVGLLPMAVAGIDVRRVIDAAIEELKALDLRSPENPAWQYAAARQHLYGKGYGIEILGCYEPSFRFMGEWWKQLYGESEGKDGKGIFPASVEFTADLHSMGQFIQAGPRTLMETIVRFSRSRREFPFPNDEQNADGLNYLVGKDMADINRIASDAVREAHVAGGVPNLVVEVPKRDEEGFAALVCFFEVACAISGYMSGVNPFDQPGVEAYKKNMFRMLGKPGAV